MFYVNCCISSCHVIVLSETWLSESVYNSELFSPTYNVLRCDRDCTLTGRSKGGGVLIALANDISFTICDVSTLRTSNPLIDIIACKCKIFEKLFIICAVYIPPDINNAEFENYMEELELVFINENLLIIGDFNTPHFLTSSINCPKSSSILQLCSSLDL